MAVADSSTRLEFLRPFTTRLFKPISRHVVYWLPGFASRFGGWFVRTVDKIDIDHPEQSAIGRPVFELHPADRREVPAAP